MSIWNNRGAPSGPGGRKPRLTPLHFAIPFGVLLLFFAASGHIDLTSAFEGSGEMDRIRQTATLQATVTARETVTAQQQTAPVPEVATIAPEDEDESASSPPACESSGDDRYCLYTVEAGDSLASIATRFGLDGGEVPGWELIFESNIPDLGSLDEALQIGMVLRIPRSNGIVHLVLPGDSVSGLAVDYDVTSEQIVAANALSDANNVQIGDILLIPEPAQLPPLEIETVVEEEPEEAAAVGEVDEAPADTTDVTEAGQGEPVEGEPAEDDPDDTGGSSESETPDEANPDEQERTDDPADSASAERRDATAEDGEDGERDEAQEQPQPEPKAPAQPEPDDASSMSWPVVQVRITNYMTARHPLGMDFGLAVAPTSPITAAAGGTVIFAGGDACCSYGNYVIVDHGNGLQTLYAHLSSISVRKGEPVGRGQTLGIAGNTGNSRGVHLHFEVYRDGKRVDPMLYLPGE